MKSDTQQDPESAADPLDEALESLKDSTRNIYRLMEARFGTYMEIAYEWTWDEAMQYLELLDVREELQNRDAMRQQAQDRAN